MGPMERIKCIGVLVLALACAPWARSEVDVVEVLPADPRLVWRGRFDRRDPSGPRCEWSGSSLVVRLRSAALNVKVSGNGNDRLQVIVDGTRREAFTPDKGVASYRVASGLPAGEHVVEIVKATEPLVGQLQFLGVSVPAGARVLPAAAPSGLKLELAGDSITCGFGNEAPDEKHHFTPLTENNTKAYGFLTARALSADYHCIAWSGRKLWPDNTLPEVYGLALPTDPRSTWDLASWVPDVIVINLGTNDFGGANPSEEPWVAAYRAFIARMRRRAPRAHVICTIGPMMNDTWSREQNALREVRRYVQRVVREAREAGDARVQFLEFPSQTPADGYGADFHPSGAMHERMAAQLTSAIRALAIDR